LVEDFTFARGQAELQSHQTLLEAADAVSRDKIPVFHTQNWYRYTFLESDLNNTKANYLRYADDTSPTYGNDATTGVVHRYGEQDPDLFAFPKPEELKDCDLIFNGITSSAVSYIYGQDFIIDRDAIVFKTNPFVNDQVQIDEIYTGTAVTDRRAVLWVYKAKLERNYITEHYGHTLGYNLPSSEPYKKLVNSAYDAIVGGTTKQDIDLALSALTGVEVARHPQETVIHILRDAKGLVIVTSLDVYRFHKSASAVVAVGDVVGSGDYLTDSVVIQELNSAEIPSFLTQLNFGPGVLSPEFEGELTFENSSKTLNITTKDSKAYLTFDIGGFPGDVELFFEELHAKGLAEGKTLAQYIDTRGDSQNSEPTASTLPTTINPLQFLVDNLLRFNMFAIKIQTHSIETDLGLSRTRIFRKLLPPWTAVVILYELEPDAETVTMDGAGTATRPGYTESVTAFTAADAITETLNPVCVVYGGLSPDTYSSLSVDEWDALAIESDAACITEQVRLYHVNGACK
tara:strand:+ start:4763 stop:6310 length:1548 start_codon:yes stop_codon:yes gene_type:complete